MLFLLPKDTVKKYKLAGLSLKRLRVLRLIQAAGTLLPLLAVSAELFLTDPGNVQGLLLYFIFALSMYFVVAPYLMFKLYQAVGVIPKNIEKKLR